MEKGDLSGSSANNSSDFVRKLYKMLEDPSYESVVRWGDQGDSFVVLENEKFTKSILPKHFKHSNFASFVRQLNKYDFHKVRQNNEENGQSPYGPGAWEFKHPEFKANSKDSLDNIRRKAPAPRKAPSQLMDETFPAQQVDLINTQLVATQHQLQHLQERYNDLANGHVVLLQQVVQLQKIVKNHDGVMHRVMGFLQMVDQQRRSSSIRGPYTNGNSSGMGIADLVAPANPMPNDRPASPLQQAAQLLGEFNAENLVNKDLEQMTVEFSHRNDYSTPPNDYTSSMGPTSAGSSAHMAYASLHNDLESMVYPVGQTQGIDPINSEHIHNIPYSIPPNGMLPADPQTEPMQTKAPGEERKKSVIDPGWGFHKPRVLLVEDDKTCARIGTKFLQTFDCGVETARDGLEAVNKVNTTPNGFDLIFMDIIMPHLDGVSATACIRDTNPTVPIVAMTSNIRADDIDMYFRYGMNDVLPKPFTKEGMFRTLEKHLSQFKKDFNPAQAQAAMYTQNAPNAPMNLNMSHLSGSHSLKDESSPGRSPASSWNSPNQMPSQSPVTSNQSTYIQAMPGGNALAGNNAYPLTPTHPQAGFTSQNPNMPTRPPHRRVMSDMSDIATHGDHPEKRQRMYPPQAGAYQQ